MPPPYLRRSFHRNDANSVTGGSLRGSTLGIHLRASRLRRSSVAASVDLARKASGYRAGFDPLALLRRLPAIVSGNVAVKSGRNATAFLPAPADHYYAELRGRVVVLIEPSDVRANAPLSRGNTHSPDSSRNDCDATLSQNGQNPAHRTNKGYRGRGTFTIQSQGRKDTKSEFANGKSATQRPRVHTKRHVEPKMAGTAMDAVILAIFSVQGTSISRQPRGCTIRIRKHGSNQNVWLKFASEHAAEEWEQALVHAASERVATVSDFEFLSPIGKGASGKVFLVRDRKTSKKFALKVVPKARVFETRSGFRHALDERLALEVVAGHPFFSQLRYAFQTRSNFYLVIDFYEGGDLYQYLRLHGGRLAEPQVRSVAAEVLLAIDYLHKCGFVYRDLKPENVLLDSAGHVRLADFGLSKFLPPSSPLTATICGTHTYAAPEMLSSRHYGTSIDAWALGIFIFHIFRGRTPFEARNLDQVIQKMNARQIRFPSSTSSALVSLIKGLLDWQPNSRLGCGSRGVDDIKDHPFFASVSWDGVYERMQHPESLYDYEESVKQVHHANAANNMLESSSPVSKSSHAASANSSSSTSASPGAKPNVAGATAADVLAETSPPAANDELRNFDLAEWANVSVDQDFDDLKYGDQSLWPMKSVRKRLEDEHFIVGFSFSKPF